MTDPAEHSPLVSPAELAVALAGDRPPLLLDVRWRLGGPAAAERYDAGHLPGAVLVDLERDLADPPGRGGRHPLPAPDRAAAALRALGVSTDRPVVAYDEGAGGAARAWWLLRHLGHPDVRVLDGGYPAWVDAGLPGSTAATEPSPGDFLAVGLDAARLSGDVIDAGGAAVVASTGILLDARSAERYAGRTEPVDPVAGHIPGAVSLPAAQVVDDRGRMLPPAQLRALIADRVGTPVDAVPVGAYCGSGITAAVLVLALESAGVRAALYPGSWSEWVTDAARPVAVGDEP